MRKLIAAALLALATFASAGASGQVMYPPPSTGLSATQRQDLSHPYEIPPGVYQVRPLHSDLCLGFRTGEGAVVSHLVLVRCDLAPGLALIPREPLGSGVTPVYTLRLAPVIDGRGRQTMCSTVARGVVFGAPRIDVLPCDLPRNAGNWRQVGEADQVFMLHPKGDGRATRVTDIPSYSIVSRPGQCWSVRDASRDPGTDLLSATCNDGGHQRFEMIYVGPLPDAEQDLLRNAGWRPGPPGRPLRKAKAVRDVDIPGGDYHNEATANDYGEACAVRCAADEMCRAFTWGPRGSWPDAHGDAAVCWLKRSHRIQPTRNDGFYSGMVELWLGERQVP